MPNKRILVIGGSGFVGAKLVKYLAVHDYIVAFTYVTHQLALGAHAYYVDLRADWESLHRCITDFTPDIVVHCAIPTTDDNTVHHRVSIESVEHITRHLDASALLIYFSTNAIFNDGGPHAENSAPQIRQDRYSVYGSTRAQGEQLVLGKWSNSLIVRTDTVNGFDVQNVLNPRLADVVNVLRQGQTIKRFQDRFITPTLIDNLVEATAETCSADFTYRGILHIAGSQRLTDYDYTCLLAYHLKVAARLIEPQLMSDSAVSTSPRDNTLDVTKAISLLKTPLLDVNAQLSRLFP